MQNFKHINKGKRGEVNVGAVESSFKKRNNRNKGKTKSRVRNIKPRRVTRAPTRKLRERISTATKKVIGRKQ